MGQLLGATCLPHRTHVLVEVKAVGGLPLEGQRPMTIVRVEAPLRVAHAAGGQGSMAPGLPHF